MIHGLGPGWAGLADELDSELKLLDPPGRLLATEVDAGGLPRFRVRFAPQVRAEGRALVRSYEKRAAALCEQCGGPGRVRAGIVVTVRCDECD